MNSSTINSTAETETAVVLWGLQEDEVEDWLPRLESSVITNFRVQPSSDGDGFSIWCDSHESVEGIETRSPHLAQRDALIRELAEMDFSINTVTAPFARSVELGIRCLIYGSTYEFEVTLERGFVTWGLWPRQWRNRRIPRSDWSPIEITRYFYDKHSFCDDSAFNICRRLASMAYIDEPIESLLAAINNIGFPVPSNKNNPYPRSDELKMQAARRRFSSKRYLESWKRPDPKPIELARGLTQQEALHFKETLFEGARNFTERYCTERGCRIIEADLIRDLRTADFRTLPEKLRDATVASIINRGLAANYQDSRIFHFGRLPPIEFRVSSQSRPVLEISDVGVHFLANDESGWLTFQFDNIEGGHRAAYGLCLLFSDAKIRGDSLDELLWEMNPSFSRRSDNYDPDNPRADSRDVMYVDETGYIGDGLWSTGMGIEDLGR